MLTYAMRMLPYANVCYADADVAGMPLSPPHPPHTHTAAGGAVEWEEEYQVAYSR